MSRQKPDRPNLVGLRLYSRPMAGGKRAECDEPKRSTGRGPSLCGARLGSLPTGGAVEVPRRGSRGLLDATTDPDKVRAWWSADPQSNMGNKNVGRSGLVCVDVDPRHDGDKTWTELV